MTLARWTKTALGAALVCTALWGCADIELRKAMSTVQVRYVRLRDAFETGSNFDARDAALELRKALEAPEVLRWSPCAGDAEYQRLLKDAVDSTERLRAVARRFDAEALNKMQQEISSRCDACHKRFRTP